MNVRTVFAADGREHWEISITNARVDRPQLSAEADFSATAVRKGTILQFDDFSGRARIARISLGNTELGNLSVSIRGKGRLNLRTGETHLDVTSLKTPWLESQGTLDVNNDSKTTMRLSGVVSRPKDAIAALGSMFPPRVSDLRVQGPLPFDAKMDLAPGKDGLHVVSTFDFQDTGLGLDKKSNVLDLTGVTGDLVVDIRSDRARAWTAEISGDMNLSGRMPGDVEMNRADLKFSLAWSRPGLTIRNFTVAAPPNGFMLGGTALDVGDASLAGRIVFEQDRVFSRDARLETGGLGRFDLELTKDPGGFLLRANGRDLDLSSAAPFIQGLSEGKTKGWSFAGRADLEFELSQKTGPGKMSLDLNLDRAGFMSPDAGMLADKGRASLHLEAIHGRTLKSSARLRVDAGELLLGTVYLNLSDNPVDIAVSGVMPSMQSIQDSNIQGRFGDFLKFSAKADAAKCEDTFCYNGSVEISDIKISNIFNTFVKEPLALTSPVAADIEFTGQGYLRSVFAGRGTRAEVNGFFNLEDTDFVTEKARIKVVGMHLALPFEYEFGREGIRTWPAPEPTDWGVIGAELIRVPMGEIPLENMPIALESNRLQLGDKLVLPLLGGTLSIDRAAVFKPLSGDFTGMAKADIQGIDFSKIRPGGIPLSGELNGDLGRVSVSREVIHTQSGLSGSFFGGAFTVEDIVIERPLAHDRLIHADIFVDNLHLEQVSRALGVGRITGRLDIDLEDLVLAFEQPVAFKMSAKSEEVEDVPQKVSLEAVNSISVVGTGSGITSAAVGVFASFLEEFSYKKIGVYCELNNDIFKIRGLIREGGVEYLIKKPLLFGINVVNSNPDNRISFSDMKERLKRVISGPKHAQGENK